MKQMCLSGLCRHLLLEFRKGDHYEAEQPSGLPGRGGLMRFVAKQPYGSSRNLNPETRKNRAFVSEGKMRGGVV